jgi:hypothetical protein
VRGGVGVERSDRWYYRYFYVDFVNNSTDINSTFMLALSVLLCRFTVRFRVAQEEGGAVACSHGHSEQAGAKGGGSCLLRRIFILRILLIYIN